MKSRFFWSFIFTVFFRLPIYGSIAAFFWQSASYVFTSRTAIAGANIGLLLVFYNSKNLNCVGALSLFFLRSVHTFS